MERVLNLEKIINNLYMNKIDFRDYEAYCKNIRLYSENDRYFDFLLALSSAEVICTTIDEENKYNQYQEYLKDLIAEIIRKKLVEKNINLEKSLNNLEKYDDIVNMSFANYSKYYGLFRLAMLAKINEEKCLGWANILLHTKVELLGVDESINYANARKLIMTYKQQLEKSINNKNGMSSKIHDMNIKDEDIVTIRK